MTGRPPLPGTDAPDREVSSVRDGRSGSSSSIDQMRTGDSSSTGWASPSGHASADTAGTSSIAGTMPSRPSQRSRPASVSPSVPRATARGSSAGSTVTGAVSPPSVGTGIRRTRHLGLGLRLGRRTRHDVGWSVVRRRRGASVESGERLERRRKHLDALHVRPGARRQKDLGGELPDDLIERQDALSLGQTRRDVLVGHREEMGRNLRRQDIPSGAHDPLDELGRERVGAGSGVGLAVPVPPRADRRAP